MKFLKQVLIIFGISCIGEMMKYFIPLPIPASIYGMVLLFIGLMSGVIKISSVREVGNFLIEIMPVMFIPAGVGLLTSWGVLKPLLVPVLVITVVTIVTVMAVSGRTSQWVITASRRKEAVNAKEGKKDE